MDYDVEMENEFIKNEIREAALEEGQALGRAEGQALGRAEGIAQNNQENAKKMKENGIDFDLISKITGLTKKQIMLL